jgi:dolichyl-phosphate-mannose--protein O-mannosyl transferase
MRSIAVWTLTGAVSIYILGWVLHFALLPLPGPGDIWGAPSGHFFHDLVAIHHQMTSAHADLAKTHPYSSPWWSWPWMVRPVFYWAEQESVLYFLGNPSVWWGSSLLLGTLSITAALARVSDLSEPVLPVDRSRQLWLPFTAWAFAWAPLALVPRILFLYHYLTPLVFAVCTVTLWLDRLGWTRAGGWRQQRMSYWLAICMIVLGFFLTAPFTFSFVDATNWTTAVFRVFPGWR